MTKLRQRLGLDLANALARHAKLATNLLECARVPINKTKAKLDNLTLAIGKRIKHLTELLLKHGERRSIGRNDGMGVLDEVAELRILLEGNGLLADLLDLAHAIGRHIHLGADLLGSRVATQILQKLALHTDELVDGLHHVHGNADGAGLIGNGARDGLTDPPRGIRGELEALLVIELLDGADEAEVTLLNKVEEERWKRRDGG